MKTADLNTLQKARATLDEKEAELKCLRDAADAVKKETEELQTVIKWLEALGGDGEDPGAKSGGLVRKLTKEKQAANFAIEYVTQYGPSTISAIYDAFAAAGHADILAGNDEGAQRITYSGHLNRDGRLSFNQDFRRWWFADRPYPSQVKENPMDVSGQHNPIHVRNMELKFGNK
jgi:hypothetical protein